MDIAAVSREGAVLLGRNFAVDAHAPRPIRIVTHIHADHIVELERSYRESLLVVATEYTMELLEILGHYAPETKRVQMSYNKPIEMMGEIVTLLPARHIVGSAQVMVEGEEYRVGYTSDFKMPGTPPMERLDVLVIDATYGSPRLQRKWSDFEAMAALLSLVEEGLKYGPVEIYAYHGKIQEIMAELRIRKVREPFVTDLRGYKMAKVAERFYEVDLEPLLTRPEEGSSFVSFVHASRFDERRGKAMKILATGWELRAPVVRVKDGVYRVGFSDHATFKEIIEYVQEAMPKKVIVDAYRGTDTRITAKYIEKALNIPAESQPEL
ncbi:MAG: MBL fold metallo-hydrolase [Acidilobaceae archaeon]|nr:MBL fold metallo-hydrolase [Acidilobaceae archaeon]MCX8165800.1 MBL fold metallo-hydrolase [Acidilobaceae archaeon]MDW7974225.1 MBL fold metallo-hydrolase [Sulfolobales archaeon]